MLKFPFFWDMALCDWMIVVQCFETVFWAWTFQPLQVRPVHNLEMLHTHHPVMHCNMIEEWTPQTQLCTSLKTCKIHVTVFYVMTSCSPIPDCIVL